MSALSTIVIDAAWQHQRATINARLVWCWLSIATLVLWTSGKADLWSLETLLFYVAGLGLSMMLIGRASYRLRRIATRLVLARNPELDFTAATLPGLRLVGTLLLTVELLLMGTLARLLMLFTLH